MYRLSMTWQNVTVFMPPANDTRLAQLFEETKKSGCFFDRKASPGIRPYLHHHVVKKTGFESGKRVKTMSGNRIWWIEMGDDNHRYIMPQGVKVTRIYVTDNGELWHIDRSLEF